MGLLAMLLLAACVSSASAVCDVVALMRCVPNPTRQVIGVAAQNTVSCADYLKQAKCMKTAGVESDDCGMDQRADKTVEFYSQIQAQCTDEKDTDSCSTSSFRVEVKSKGKCRSLHKKYLENPTQGECIDNTRKYYDCVKTDGIEKCGLLTKGEVCCNYSEVHVACSDDKDDDDCATKFYRMFYEAKTKCLTLHNEYKKDKQGECTDNARKYYNCIKKKDLEKCPRLRDFYAKGTSAAEYSFLHVACTDDKDDDDCATKFYHVFYEERSKCLALRNEYKKDNQRDCTDNTRKYYNCIKKKNFDKCPQLRNRSTPGAALANYSLVHVACTDDKDDDDCPTKVYRMSIKTSSKGCTELLLTAANERGCGEYTRKYFNCVKTKGVEKCPELIGDNKKIYERLVKSCDAADVKPFVAIYVMCAIVYIFM